MLAIIAQSIIFLMNWTSKKWTLIHMTSRIKRPVLHQKKKANQTTVFKLICFENNRESWFPLICGSKLQNKHLFLHYSFFPSSSSRKYDLSWMMLYCANKTVNGESTISGYVKPKQSRLTEKKNPHAIESMKFTDARKWQQTIHWATNGQTHDAMFERWCSRNTFLIHKYQVFGFGLRSRTHST